MASICVALCYVGFQKIVKWRMHDPVFFKAKLGYALPEHWDIENVSTYNGKYYWAIDGGIDEAWIESMHGEPILPKMSAPGNPNDSGIVGWRITNESGTSRIMRRCMKGCCIYVEVSR